jgi:hypothetical protein
VRPGGLDASGHGELAQAAGASMTVHPGAAAVEQDWPSVPSAYCPVDGTVDRWRRRDLDYLGALAAHAQHSVAALLAEVGDVCEPSRPSMATSAKSHGFGDSRAAVSRALNCR